MPLGSLGASVLENLLTDKKERKLKYLDKEEKG